MPKASKRKLGTRLALTSLVLLLALLSAEFLVRAFQPKTEITSGYPRGLQCRDDTVGFRLSPHFEGDMVIKSEKTPIKINAMGFRDEDLAQNAFRILSMGDSFCFGHGVRQEQTYTAKLESVLTDSGVQVQALNLGAPGYNTHNAIELLRAEADTLKPDLVVLGFYVGNDITANHEDHLGRFVVRSGLLVLHRPGLPDWELSAKSFLYANSRLIPLLYSFLGKKESRSPCDALLWDQGFALGVIEKNLRPKIQEAMLVTQETLRGLQRLSSNIGAPLVLVLLPGPYQYKTQTLQAVVRLCDFAPEHFDTDQPNRILHKFAESIDLPTLDLLPAFREATQKGERLHLDVHFNRAGHELAGQLIANYLLEKGLVR